MKSLEILEHVKNAPEFMGGDERYKRSINSPIRYIEDITAIKQDLEDYAIIREIEEKVREGKMVVRNGKKYYASEFILAEQGTIRHLTIWYDDYKKVISFDDYKKTWCFED